MTRSLCADGLGRLDRIAELKALIDDAFVDGAPFRLDIGGVEAADLSFIQLIAAARRHAADHDIDLTLSAPAPAPVRDLLARAGFLAAATPADLTFWFHGDTVQ